MLGYLLAGLGVWAAVAAVGVGLAARRRLRRRPRPREPRPRPGGPPETGPGVDLSWHRRRAPRLARLDGGHRLLAPRRN